MLKQLKIRNYALIEELDVQLDKGLTIITGETGAGKSIVLGALGLLQGKRADTKALFDPENKCIVEGVFVIERGRLEHFFDENDLDYEPETCVRREISSKGKSRAFINDTPVNLQQLTQLSEHLLDIHSQHQTLSIKSASFQRTVLDVCADQMPVTQQYHADYKGFAELKSKLEELQQQQWQGQKERDYNAYLLQELEEVQPEVGELTKLEQQYQQAQHSTDIQQVAGQAADALILAEDNISDRLAAMAKLLTRLDGKVDGVAALSEKLNDLSVQVGDAGQQVEGLMSGFDLQPDQVDRVVVRLDKLNALLSKHRVNDLEALMAIWESLGTSADQEGHLEEEIARLKSVLTEMEAKLYDQAKTISTARNNVIPVVVERIATLLNEMGMPSARITVEMSIMDELGPSGIDHIEYLFSANKGKDPQPLDKVASGGELSRLMLAIRSLVSQNVALPTMIFDEIDTGVSGEMADKMGVVMKGMADHMQVISITHLPQIAARASAHFKVFKSEDGQRTTSHLTSLSKAERIEELAKMLSGSTLTDAAKDNAKALLDAV